MNRIVRVYPVRCEQCARDWGNEIVDVLNPRDFCNHSHLEFRDWTHVPTDEITSSVTGPPQQDPYDFVPTEGFASSVTGPPEPDPYDNDPLSCRTEQYDLLR